MKLSTTTRYGLKALCDLCSHQSQSPDTQDKPVTVNDIAERQNIPANYLVQLFSKLRRGGLLKSVRGAQGGYLLVRPPSEISIAQVIDALGEKIVFGNCQTPDGCLNAPTCPTFKLWHNVKQSVDEILAETTLEDLSHDQTLLMSGGSPDETEQVREDARSRARATPVTKDC